MIIDIHTHAFPDFLAQRALAVLAEKSGPYQPVLDGTIRGLLQSMDEARVTRACVASIATRPQQAAAILAWSREIASDRIVPLGSVHPRSPAWEQEIDAIADTGLVGIKLHPHYQSFVVDETRYFAFYEKLASRRLFVLFHAGYDIAFPEDECAAPERLARVHDAIPNLVMIAAHVGGWHAWGRVLKHLVGRSVFLDTSFVQEVAAPVLEQILSRHDRQRILFGSDTPWLPQSESVEHVLRLPIDADYKDQIFQRNALALLP